MNYCTSNLELVPTSRAAKAAWKARCCEGTTDLSGIPLRIGYNTIGRNFSPGADYLWLGIPAAAQGVRERHVRLRPESQRRDTVGIKAYAPVRIREISGEVISEFLEGAEGRLVVGQSLELDVDGLGRTSRCKYSYALQLAPSISSPATVAQESRRNSTAPSPRRVAGSTSSGGSGVWGTSGGASTCRIVTSGRRNAKYQAAGLDTGEKQSETLFHGLLHVDVDDDDVVEEVEGPCGREATPSTATLRRRKIARYHHLVGSPFSSLDLVDLSGADDSVGAGRGDNISIRAGASPSTPLVVESDDEVGADPPPRGADPSTASSFCASYSSHSGVKSSPGRSAVGTVLLTKATERRISSSSVSTAHASNSHAVLYSAPSKPDSTIRVHSPTIAVAGEGSKGYEPSFLPREKWVRCEGQAASEAPPSVSPVEALTSSNRTHRPEQGQSGTRSPSHLDTARLCDLETTLRITVKAFPASVSLVTEELLARGSPPPRGLLNVLVSELLKSTCPVRTEYLRRQLSAVLSVSSELWHPPNPPGAAGRWLDEVMVGITTNGGRKNLPREVTILDAHVVVLELIVTFVSRGCESMARAEPTVAAGTTRIDRLRKLFAWAKQERGDKALRKSASRAVAKCARWLVDVWRSTMPPNPARRGLRCAGASVGGVVLNCPVHARARLLMGQLLAEVVDSCGLSLREACVVVRDEVEFCLPVPSEGTGNGSKADLGTETESPEPADGPPSSGALDAAALAGLMRSLCRRPLCVTLAQLLSDGLRLADISVEADDVDRLKCLLARLSRHPARGGMLLPP